jgi:methyltransferase (TIGR00027 family)
MADGGIKSTAQAMAYVRASEEALGPDERLFDDPFAPVFLSRAMRWSLPLLRSRRFYAFAMWARNRQAPGVWGSLLARTRYIDDALFAAVESRIEQVVILGAGADSRAFRIHGIEATAVFEVDHPGTQQWKQAQLAKAISPLPSHVTFVPVDFERDSLEHALPAAGYRAGVRTFFIWEGVTQYIQAEAVDATLRFVRDHSASGSRIVFTYVDRRALEGSTLFGDLSWMLEQVKRTGEPWVFGLLPDELPVFLQERGLRLVEHVGEAEFHQRIVPAARGLKISKVERAVLAERP